MSLQIRTATIEDVETLFDLIKKLARYEKKEPEEIGLTIEKIQKHGFGKNPYFQTLIADYDKKSVGYALYFFTYAATAGNPILYLEDLFVEESCRGKGIGKSLLSHLAKLALKEDCCRMEWHAFTWNQAALSFYEGLGSIPKTDLVQVRLSALSLAELADSN